MSNRIAFFDFDGTITKKDSLLEFIKHSKGVVAFYVGFCLHLHYLFAFKLKIISNQKAKEKILTHFFGGLTIEEFTHYCQTFSDKKIPGLIRPAAISEINRLKKENVKIVIVTASPENWIKDWAQKIDADLIATKLLIHNGKITGEIEGINCHGKEKARRIEEKYTLGNYTEIFAYGDSSGDREMLLLAHKGFMKPFE